MCFLHSQTIRVCLILGLVFNGQAIKTVSSANFNRCTTLRWIFRGIDWYPKGTQNNGKHVELGCEFEDETYRTIQSMEPIWFKKPIGEVFVVSKEESKSQQKDNPNPNKTESNSNTDYNQLNFIGWNEFKESLKNSFIKTVTASRLNTMDSFLWFIQAYLLNLADPMGTGDLWRFFRYFKVPYWADENPAGILIETFHQMVKETTANPANENRTQQRREAYLVSANIDPNNLVVSNLNKGYPELNKKQFQDHVAGAIKFYLGTREGYVLLDPGCYYNNILISPFAVVLMQDERPPHQEILWGNEMMKYVTFKMGNPEDMWVLATYPVPRSEVKHVVYYLGQAYCSFLESTTKGHLLQPYKGMFNFDMNASAQAFFKIDIENGGDVFSLGIYDEWEGFSANINPHPKEYKFTEIVRNNYTDYKYGNDGLLVLDRFSVWTQLWLEESCGYLRMSTNTLVGRMHFIYNRFFKDSDLIGNWIRIASNITNGGKVTRTPKAIFNMTKKPRESLRNAKKGTEVMSKLRESLRLLDTRHAYNITNPHRAHVEAQGFYV